MKLLILLLALIVCCDSFKVLVFYPIPIRSINILGEAQVRYLINAGHEVTYVTVFPLKNKPEENYYEIDLSKNLEMIQDDPNLRIEYIMKNGIHEMDVNYFLGFSIEQARRTFVHPSVKKLLEDRDQHFDVVIADFFTNEIYAALAALYNCPMIWTYSMGTHWHTVQLVEDPPSSAYSVDFLSPKTPPLSFIERAQGLVSRIRWYYIQWFTIIPSDEKLYITYFTELFKNRGRTLPEYSTIIYNASLVFVNAHNSLGSIPSLPQNYRMIGGIHVNQHIAPLSEDLKTIMDSSKTGVIYFSMGSTWKSKNMPKVVTDSLLKMFGQLNETVIWKYEDEMQNLPENVHIVKWAPQPAILSHPKCLFFITHGGLLSSTEAIHFGVPVIGIPIAFDQIINVKKAVLSGYALKVDLNYEMPQNLYNSIKLMLSNTKFAERAKELSMIYHDRPTPPHKELVHWVEHVVRTRGAAHLRSPALFVPWYQKMYLDLVIVTFLVIFTLITMIVKINYFVKTKVSVKQHKS